MVWLIIAAVVIAVGTLLGLMDRSARRKGHVVRRAANIAAIERSRRTNVRRGRPRSSPTPPSAGKKYPKL
jgi:hypothetical protein